ncbi:phosphate ABC transporter permease subunit PstC [Parasphingopyxis marina]|uniref:Phosphate transport system permease protein n=1 Tax=Parasphingopyxis marina TaxID=2761622 RepID=A0A842HY87_9SPHN|nr:phosphate ABC transporter permease subunit PstC [Parasphingopyxis marina]MBC2777311.1 phosphate ABC transporter permease subunit PstC [Parasphingopyxis marina]
MSLFSLFFLILGLAAIGWITARMRAMRMRPAAPAPRPHSLPGYHGWYVALWLAIPALAFLVLWSILMPGLVEQWVLASPAAQALPAADIQRTAILSEAHALADGSLSAAFNEEARALVPAFQEANSFYGTIGIVATLLLAFAGGGFAFLRVRPDFRARNRVEKLVMWVLLLASLIAILTTVGIVASLLFETIVFFDRISITEFLFGTHWNPQSATAGGDEGSFGAIPLFWGTILIGAIIAMIVAIPLGLMSAVYLTQYARPRVRSIMKPVLEILAGVPTVVYGYFAALTVAPAVRDFAVNILGVSSASSESAIAAGVVMGVMIIPFVSSMADDSLAAVPGAMRDGSLAMGATSSETIKRVLIPAALPGIVGGVLLAVSRAIGETMIVVMAAGLAANLTANPFESVTTVTVQIVQLLTGDQEFNSSKTLAAFALGLVLFIVTLLLNIIALSVVKRFREAYE